MVDIKVSPVYSVIDKTIPHKEWLALVKEIDNFLKVKTPNYQYATAYKMGLWDGYSRFITAYGSFLTGLLPLLERVYDINKIYRTDYIKKSTPLDFTLKGSELRGYQRTALTKAIEAQRGVVKMPPGSGKTEVGCAIANNTVEFGKVLWVTHTLDLVKQTEERFKKRTKLKVSLTTEGNVDVSGDVIISTVQTLARNMDNLAEFLAMNIKTVILDECHLGTAKTWEEVLRACKSAWFRYGLSATPSTDNPVRDMKLRGLLGDIVYSADPSILKEEGFIVNATVFGFPCYHKEYMSYPDALHIGVVTNKERNQKIIEVSGKEKGGLILVNYIQHGKLLEQMARESGLKTLFLYGNLTSDVRLKAVNDLKAGNYDFLIASTIFDFGVDIPELKWVFLASPTKSSVRIIQRIGRGSRKSSGKIVANIFTFFDKGDKYLFGATKKLIKVIEKEKLDVAEC